MDDLERFKAEVEDYLTRESMTPTALGVRAAGDPNFVFDLRNGREPRRDTIARVRGFMSQPAAAGAAA